MNDNIKRVITQQEDIHKLMEALSSMVRLAHCEGRGEWAEVARANEVLVDMESKY